MAKKKTVEITLTLDGELFAIYRKTHGSWVPTYTAKQVLVSADHQDHEIVFTIMDSPFQTIKQIEKHAEIYGLTVNKNQQLSMFQPYSLTGTDRAKRFADKQKKEKKKRLAIWLNAVEFQKLNELKEELFKLGLITKPTQQQAIKYMLLVHPNVPY